MFIPSIFAGIITQMILLYCGYRSFKAIESDVEGDDTKWLTFWFVYSIVSFAKSIVDYVGSIIPFYVEANIALVVFLGFFGGAEIAYKQVIGPILLQYQGQIDEAIAEAKAKAKEVAKQAQAQAQEALKQE